jgi:transcriptional regulator with XRE-family HTH domain
MDNNVFGERLKKIRETRKYSQTDLAGKIGVSKTSLSAYESGTKKPSYEVVANIARVCGTSMDWLCGFGESENDSLNNFGEFLKLFFKILKSNIIEVREDEHGRKVFALHYAFDKFEDSYFKLLELYKTGAIDEEVFNLWSNNETEKYKNTYIDKEIENWEKEVAEEELRKRREMQQFC